MRTMAALSIVLFIDAAYSDATFDAPGWVAMLWFALFVLCFLQDFKELLRD